MGIIASSTIFKSGDSKSSSSYYQLPAERRRAHEEAIVNATIDLIARELDALFPPKLGDTSSADPPNEIDPTKRDEETELRLIKCMHAHSDYYQPILDLKKASEDLLLKDILAFAVSEGVLSEEEAATEQANGFW
ncbi:hypothetical protein AtNW77_Chr1g0020181 [Arabidopsis thaliana]|nr:GCK domain protein [Arabidopsis thaliana]ANM59522.1 GCK domain protein [Arabidopsis thaliana]|eukprot:NP_001321875.1 GCK domain protein [Arabidopsis thaliana]